MSYRLSLLDKSPVAGGMSGDEALRTTLEAAQLADRLGYHRYWLAEHHGLPGLASAAPEVLIAQILARTRSIRVGSGGILLQNYGAWKVAEIFSVLAALHPGRVDLGVGKSPGGLPQVTRALQRELREGSAAEVGRKLTELAAWLKGPAEGAEILPRPESGPQPFLLGGSLASAEQALSLGWSYVHAGHQDGNPELTAKISALFHHARGEGPVLAVAAFAAPTREEAEARIGGLTFVKVTFEDGHSVNLTSEEGAREYARQYGPVDYDISKRTPVIVAGTAEDVHDRLSTLSQRYGIHEFVLDQPVAEAAARLNSISLIARPVARAVA